jgi:hypothetical protein
MVTDNDLSQLKISGGKILSPGGVVGWIDYGHNYVYVCFYQNKMVVAEYNNLDSVLTRLVTDKITQEYYYAFKIICAGGVTAIIKWVEDDVILVGITSGYYETGERIWTPAEDIKTWPGLRE